VNGPCNIKDKFDSNEKQQNFLYLDFLSLDLWTFHRLVFRTEYDVSKTRLISFFG